MIKNKKVKCLLILGFKYWVIRKYFLKIENNLTKACFQMFAKKIIH